MDEATLRKLSEYLSGQGNPVLSDSMSALERLYAKPAQYMSDRPTVDWQQQMLMRSDPEYRENVLRTVRGIDPRYVPAQYKPWLGKYSM